MRPLADRLWGCPAKSMILFQVCEVYKLYLVIKPTRIRSKEKRQHETFQYCGFQAGVKVKEHFHSEISSHRFPVPFSCPQPYMMLKEPHIHHEQTGEGFWQCSKTRL